jgi:hypothetical protein
MRERRTDPDRPAAAAKPFIIAALPGAAFRLAEPVDRRVKPGHDGFPLSVH